MTRLDGTIALVTGSSSGIGAATVERLAADGAQVVGWDVQEPLDDLPLKRHVEMDVTDAASVSGAMTDLVEGFGRIDVLVNAAGVAGGGPMHLIDDDEWSRVIAVNLTGTALVCKHALTTMVEQRSGSIVNIASIEGIEGTEGGSAYNASKGGVVLLTKNMAIDYGPLGIRSNCVCPGLIDTPLSRSIYDDPNLAPFREVWIRDTHLGRLGRPDEIAACAAFLASNDASFVNGHTLVADGGYTAGHRFGLGELIGLT
ncbi:MAG: SDR family NAD(P)-dependent oxidoreductase [Acidimicrobiales bacterium]